MLWKLLLLALAGAPLALPQSNTLPNRETLSYSIEWRLITAGKARLELAAAPQFRQGYQVKLHLESVGLVSKLFKVEDDYLSNLTQGLCAVSAQMTTHEGSRQRDANVTFDYDRGRATYVERDRVRGVTIASQQTEIPSCVHDVIGGLYFLRTLRLEPGQSTTAPVSDGKKSVMARVEAQQREDVRVPSGSFRAIRYEVFLFDNVLFRRSARLFVWVTDDRRRLPVQIRVRMAFTVGTITLQMEGHEQS
jgi:hypothetical protein